MYETIGVIIPGRVVRNIVLHKESTERIVSISWVCDILYQFHLLVDYFLGFVPWRFPSF